MDERLPVPLPNHLEEFLARRSPVISSYTLFRPEFEMESVFKAFALVKRDYPALGLVIAGPNEVPVEIQELLLQLGLEDSILIAGNLSHPEFLTVVQRSCFFLRSHRRDGVCASVLETLRLGVPVVAVEDGIRPKSVITYPPSNAEALEKTLNMVLRNPERFRAQVVAPDVPNSLEEEVDFLLRAGAAA
jgi:glycosyltransferase involved in cell wall biosynthesis